MEELTAKLDQFFEQYGLTNKDPSSREYFSATVKIAINEFELSPKMMASDLEVGISTVKRW